MVFFWYKRSKDNIRFVFCCTYLSVLVYIINIIVLVKALFMVIEKAKEFIYNCFIHLNVKTKCMKCIFENDTIWLDKGLINSWNYINMIKQNSTDTAYNFRFLFTKKIYIKSLSSAFWKSNMINLKWLVIKSKWIMPVIDNEA